MEDVGVNTSKEKIKSVVEQRACVGGLYDKEEEERSQRKRELGQMKREPCWDSTKYKTILCV